MRLEDVFDCVAESAVAAAVRRDVVSIAFDLIAGVGHGDRQATVPHHRKINHVIANECGFRGLDPFLTNYFAKDGELILDALVNMFQLQIAGAKSDGF